MYWGHRLLMMLPLALASFFLLSDPALAQVGCVPNPNLTGPPFVNGCPLPPSALNGVATTSALSRLGADVKNFGAKGDGVTDDTSAIQAAINSVSSGGVVLIPQGYYCIKTGPLTVSVQGVTIQAKNRQGATVFDTCGADFSVITMTGVHDEIRDLQLIGSPIVGTSQPVVNLNPGCAECTLNNDFISGGSNAVFANAGEVYIEWTKVASTYGSSVIYLKNTGGYIKRVKADQPYPAGTPTRFVTKPAWAPTTGYATKALVTDGGWIIQATNGGTSGSSMPTVLKYGANITDGSVTWQLVGPSTYFGVNIDTGSGADLYIEDSDFSSTYTTAIAMTNSLSGNAPNFVTISNNTLASYQDFGIDLSAGYQVQLIGNTFGGCLITGCTGIVQRNAYVGDTLITGNHLIGHATGILLNAGTKTEIVDNGVADNTTGLSVGANISNWKYIGNNGQTSAQFGAMGSSTCVFVASGTSDHYDIVGNDCSGGTTTINDGGTGIHKTIVDDDFNTTKFNQHLLVSHPVPSIASGFGTSPSVTGSDSAMRINVGTGGVATTGTVNFGVTWPNAPTCVANDEVTGILTRASASTTQAVVSASSAWTASDTVTVNCVGY